MTLKYVSAVTRAISRRASLQSGTRWSTWFDVVTSIGSGDAIEAILEAVFAELPLAVVCALIVYDAERFIIRFTRSG